MKTAMIVDYGCGNVNSLIHFFNKLNFKSELTKDVDKIIEGDLLILPGVGAFGVAHEAMVYSNILESITGRTRLDKPTLGICLGFQMLTKSSDEAPGKNGLSVFDLETVKMSDGPEIGWKEIVAEINHDQIKEPFFFNHSFGIISKSEDFDGSLIPESSYLAYARKSMTIGVQFHPEKSQNSGRKFMNVLLDQIWRF